MLGPTSFKKAIEEAEKLSESLKLRSGPDLRQIYVNVDFICRLILTFFNRYEEVEVRKRLEEKERQEEKKRREEVTEKESGRSSPKANKKDGKKVKNNPRYKVQ